MDSGAISQINLKYLFYTIKFTGKFVEVVVPLVDVVVGAAVLDVVVVEESEIIVIVGAVSKCRS